MIVECPGCKSRHDVTGRPAGTSARCRCGQVFALPKPAESARQLACPSCGAGVAPDASTCQFCAGKLLVRACPRCFARVFHGHRHCAHCGVEVGVPARANPDGSAAARTCPSCVERPVLEARLVGDVLLDECTACFGLWLDSAALARVLRERAGSSTAPLRNLGVVPQDLSPAGNPAAPPTGRRMYVPCPDCGTVMNRVNFAGRSGIVLDVCRAHGTWFDAGELPRVIDFVIEGGVEEASRRDLEDARDAARRARKEAEAAQASDTRHVTDRVHSSVHLFGYALSGIAKWLARG